ncbi:hypothetical protein Tco_0320502 [Tanacetum coccineum]
MATTHSSVLSEKDNGIEHYECLLKVHLKMVTCQQTSSLMETEGSLQPGSRTWLESLQTFAREKERYKADIPVATISYFKEFQKTSYTLSTTIRPQRHLETISRRQSFVVNDVRGRYNANNSRKTISEEQCKRNVKLGMLKHRNVLAQRRLQDQTTSRQDATFATQENGAIR